MSQSRRDFNLSLSAFVAVPAALAQKEPARAAITESEGAPAPAQNQAASDVLPSHCYPFGDMPVKANAETHGESRQVFKGTTHDGFVIGTHITKLAPGHMPHPPHQHVHEETIFIQQGTLEFTIDGKSSTIGPGSVTYLHTNDLHSMKNVGTDFAQYFVVEFDGMKT